MASSHKASAAARRARRDEIERSMKLGTWSLRASERTHVHVHVRVMVSSARDESEWMLRTLQLCVSHARRVAHLVSRGDKPSPAWERSLLQTSVSETLLEPQASKRARSPCRCGRQAAVHGGGRDRWPKAAPAATQRAPLGAARRRSVAISRDRVRRASAESFRSAAHSASQNGSTP